MQAEDPKQMIEMDSNNPIYMLLLEIIFVNQELKTIQLSLLLPLKEACTPWG